MTASESYSKRRRELEAEVENAEASVEWAQEDLDRAVRDLENFTSGEAVLPDKATLLALYGAPGNWPIEAAA